MAVNVIHTAVEAHSFHTRTQGSFTNRCIVFCKQGYDYHLVGLTQVEVFFDCFSNSSWIRALIVLLETIF